MKVGVFSTKPYTQTFFEQANEAFGHELLFFESRLTVETAGLVAGLPAICAFVNDVLDARVLCTLADGGTRLIALRCAGFNNVDLSAARRHKLTVVRVPTYSPHAVAEHAVALMLTLNRKIHRAAARVREGNFALDGLMGFDMHGRTAGIVGTGRIGFEAARILYGFGCRLLAYDVAENPDCVALGVRYEDLDRLFAESDIVSLHCPLLPSTRHLINDQSIAHMKPGVMLINTSRGALIDTRAVIDGLKSGRIGYLGLDVYEEEANLFFEDLSDQVIQDDVFARLTTFPNVVITGHQGFFTRDALDEITRTTLANISDYEAGRPCPNEISIDRLRK